MNPLAPEVQGQVADTDDMVEMVMGEEDRDRVILSQQGPADPSSETTHARTGIQDEQILAQLKHDTHGVALLRRYPAS